MKKWKKIVIGVAAVVVVAIGVSVALYQSRKGIVTVQTGKVARQDLVSQVTASGEIKPLARNYVNVSATAFGRITHIAVQEGDHVKKGQLLAQLESVQPAAELAAQEAQLGGAEVYVGIYGAASQSAEAEHKTALAELDRAKAEIARATLDFARAEDMRKNELISTQEFDARKAAYEVAKAVVEEKQAKAAQNRAKWEQAEKQRSIADMGIAQYRATVRGAADRLAKTTFLSPLDGIVTNLPVHPGEYVVVGFQNSPGSLVMTIADLSVVTAEVKVDETDIVNVRLGQPAEVTIDAIPNKTFKGKVTEIGNSAIIRSTGLASSQSNIASQEAKDFKVVVTLESPPENLRPGLSATAKVQTATKKSVLAIPIQALTIRQKAELEGQDQKDKGKSGSALAAGLQDREKEKEAKKEIQGVFAVRGKSVQFLPVETGITGTTDIEVTSGLKEGDEIVTGSYKVLRTIRNNATVKVDNKAPKKPEENK